VKFLPEKIDSASLALSLLQSAVKIHIQRGGLDDARRMFSTLSGLEESTDVQERRASSRRAPLVSWVVALLFNAK
jgi:hypothetical protein